MEFKHILWVEDKAGTEAKGASLIKLPGFDKETVAINKNFKAYADEVKICQTFSKAVKLICSEEIYQYDCIILDLDLTSGNDNGIPHHLLEEHGIDIKDLSRDDLLENGGYYIYLLLLSRTFPASRIRVLSAHGGGVAQTALTEKFRAAGIRPPQKFGDNKEIDLSPYLDRLFNFKQNPYYRIRSFIYYVCCNCQDFINSKSFDINAIAYNRYVYGNDKKLDKEEFLTLLDNIKLQLPLTIASTPEELSRRYKNILRFLTEHFHANLNKKYSSDDNQLMCWKIVTLIRNWMAHGKLNHDKLNSINFLILFTLCVRTIFGNMGSTHNAPINNNNHIGYNYDIEQWKETAFESDIFSFLSEELNSRSTNESRGRFLSDEFADNSIMKQFITIFDRFSEYDGKEESILSPSYITMIEKLGGRSIHSFQGEFDMFLKAICFYPAERTRISINQQSMVVKWNIPDEIKDEILGRNGDYDFIRKLRMICASYLNNRLDKEI